MAEKIRRFTKVDWYGYAGAEEFNPESQPFIFEKSYPDGDITIVADKNGIGVTACDKYMEDTIWFKEIRFTAIMAEAAMRELVTELDGYNDLVSVAMWMSKKTGWERC